MLRSLYSGVSGMRNFQTKMDVIANNIANVNTTAFKSGRAKFQDLLNQSVASAQGPQAGGRGGVNPQQIGLGVRVGSIDTIMEGGAMQPTNRGLDFAIAGEGFFTVSPDKDGSTALYTRDGAFYVDAGGNLTNASGLNVIGYKPSGTSPSYTKVGGYKNQTTEYGALKIPQWVTGTEDRATEVSPAPATPEDTHFELQAFSIDGTGTIKANYKNDKDELIELILGQISITTFSNPTGLTKDGGNNYIASNNSGDPQIGQAGTGSRGVVNQGFLEMSNVDLANEFTEMIVTSRAYQANSRSITTSDEMIQELLNLKR